MEHCRIETYRSGYDSANYINPMAYVTDGNTGYKLLRGASAKCVFRYSCIWRRDRASYCTFCGYAVPHTILWRDQEIIPASVCEFKKLIQMDPT